MKYRRVVITGIGLVTPLGHSFDEFRKNLLNGYSSADNITHFNAEKFKVSKRAIQIDLRFLRENWKEGKLTSSRGVHCVKINKNIADKYLELQKKTFI